MTSDNAAQARTGGFGGLDMETIYNLLMTEVEPELTTMVMPHLDEIYKDETPKEKKKRNKRYAKAFKKYDKRFKKAMGIWKEQILKFKTAAFALAKKRSGEDDQNKLADIERSLGSL